MNGGWSQSHQRPAPRFAMPLPFPSTSSPLAAPRCALLALMAAVGAAWTQMFVWLGVALIIDGIDGPLARRLGVAERLPRWSGDLLDFVVDYVTYVFVPAYAMVASGLLPASVSLALGLIVTVTGALYFADRQMKTSDSYFRGFPALWNVVAFYLFVLKPAPWLGAGVIIALAAATFAPIISSIRCECRDGVAQHGRAGTVGIARAVRARAKPRSAGLGRGGACRDCLLFRDRWADAPRGLIPCAALMTTYDRALAKELRQERKMVAAVRVHKVGGPEVLTYEQVDVPPPGQARFGSSSTPCGVNFVDVYFRIRPLSCARRLAIRRRQ